MRIYREDVFVDGQAELLAEASLQGLLPESAHLWRSCCAGVHQRCAISLLLRVGCAPLRGRSLLLIIGILFCFCTLLCTLRRVLSGTLDSSLTCTQIQKLQQAVGRLCDTVTISFDIDDVACA